VNAERACFGCFLAGRGLLRGGIENLKGRRMVLEREGEHAWCLEVVMFHGDAHLGTFGSSHPEEQAAK